MRWGGSLCLSIARKQAFRRQHWPAFFTILRPMLAVLFGVLRGWGEEFDSFALGLVLLAFGGCLP